MCASRSREDGVSQAAQVQQFEFTPASLGPNFALDEAAFHGHWKLCEFLIENGADVNHRLSDTGETPLHAALCKANRPAYDLVVRVLLAAGADPNLATHAVVETGAFMRDCRTKPKALETLGGRIAAVDAAPSVKAVKHCGVARDRFCSRAGFPYNCNRLLWP